MKKGLLIDFEGLDYSFKETNSKRLYEYIKENVTDKVELLSFPNYECESALFVKNYLSGMYGKASELNPYQATTCYALDRFHTMKVNNIKDKLDNGWIIILDRYVGSNLIFQSSKLAKLHSHELESYIKWTLDFEYNKLGLPKEDITIYMDMPIDISHDLMLERKLKSGTSTDGHEDNYQYMKKVESTAKNKIVPFLNYKVVNCIDENNNIRTKDEIFNDILSIIKKLL